MSSVQQELREILDALEARGFTARSSDGHYKIFYGNQPVMWKPNPDEDVALPVTLPGTPSDARWRENTIAMLIRAKLLDDDPKKEGQRGLTPEDEERRAREREERERRQAEAHEGRQQQSAEDTDRAAMTAALRERASAVLGPLGVWKPGVKGGKPGRVRRTYQEASRVAYAWSEQYGIEPCPPSPQAAAKAFRFLFEKNTVNDRDREWIEKFLDEVSEAEDPHAFYFGLLRELLGLKDYGAEGEQPEPEPQEPAREPSGAEPLKIDAEDDPRVRDLREALAEARRDLDAHAERLRVAERVVRTREEEAASALAEAREARELAARMEAASTNGHEPRIPELAFEVLGEMLGQYVTVAADDGGAANLSDVMELIDVKRQKAVVLAKRVAALEVGAEVEA